MLGKTKLYGTQHKQPSNHTYTRGGKKWESEAKEKKLVELRANVSHPYSVSVKTCYLR